MPSMMQAGVCFTRGATPDALGTGSRPINRLRTPARRREEYVRERLPEPVLTGPAPPDPRRSVPCSSCGGVPDRLDGVAALTRT